MRLYLAGQTNFGNRGCEALVRACSGLLTKLLPGTEFLVPSFDPAADKRQWAGPPGGTAHFVQPLTVPSSVKWWNRVATRLPIATTWWEPSFNLPEPVRGDVLGSDAVLMIGGDNISLDYGLGSLFLWSGMADAAGRLGRKTVLCAASVGPFARMPVIEAYMTRHLRRYSAITVRESETFGYLRRLGIENVELAPDFAFALEPEEWRLTPIFESPSEGILGFNVSPLIQALRDRSSSPIDIVEEATFFLERVVFESGCSVVLVPHVDPLNGSSDNSDAVYMNKILERFRGDKTRIAMLPRGLNAAQLKFALGRCRFFIGARTHSTIAAWSMCVPTVSIAYSIKAKGLNKDLFGDLDLVLETPLVNRESLWASYLRLVEREGDLRAVLSERIPEWRSRVVLTAERIANLVR